MYELAAEFYPDYPDPMPDFGYLGDQGRGLLESALRNPSQTFDGRFLYPTIYDKAAILLQTIIRNHPFLDGNKRMGLTAAFVFMLYNGRLLFTSKDTAVTMCLRIAGLGAPAEFTEIKRWLMDNSIPLGGLLEWEQSPADNTALRRQTAAAVETLNSILARLDALTTISDPIPPPEQ